jgi:hypothetical protein
VLIASPSFFAQRCLQQMNTGQELMLRSKIDSIAGRVLDGTRRSAAMTLVDIGTGDGLIAFRKANHLFLISNSAYNFVYELPRQAGGWGWVRGWSETYTMRGLEAK